MDIKFKPIGGNILVKPELKKTVTDSGIVLPESGGNERPERGKIVAVGEGKLNDKGERKPLTVKVGDNIVFKKYSPDEIKIDGEDYLIMTEDEILGIIV